MENNELEEIKEQQKEQIRQLAKEAVIKSRQIQAEADEAADDLISKMKQAQLDLEKIALQMNLPQHQILNDTKRPKLQLVPDKMKKIEKRDVE